VNNAVMAARFAYLTTREDDRLARQQARTACAAALLRWIHVVITCRVAWDPAVAAGRAPVSRPHERHLSALTTASGTREDGGAPARLDTDRVTVPLPRWVTSGIADEQA
jgi:hypothetical protein